MLVWLAGLINMALARRLYPKKLGSLPSWMRWIQLLRAGLIRLRR